MSVRDREYRLGIRGDEYDTLVTSCPVHLCLIVGIIFCCRGRGVSRDAHFAENVGFSSQPVAALSPSPPPQNPRAPFCKTLKPSSVSHLHSKRDIAERRTRERRLQKFRGLMLIFIHFLKDRRSAEVLS